MNLRNVALASTVVGIPLALLILLLPIRWGYGGYEFAAQNSFVRFQYVDRSGPGARAGIGRGDIAEPLTGYESVANLAGPVGTVVDFRIIRNGRVVPAHVMFEPFPPALAYQENVGRILSALTALGAFIITLLVGLRARDRRAGTRAVVVLVSAAWLAATTAGALVAPNLWLAFLAFVLPGVFVAAALCAGLALLAIFPPNATRRRTLLGRSAPWLFALFAVNAACLVGLFWGVSALLDFAQPASYALAISIAALLGVSIVDAMVTAAPEFRTPIRWLGGSWLLAIVLIILGNGSALLGIGDLQSHYGDALFDVVIFLLAFGVAYPVLRHRLVDLNLVVTRASAFAIVSIIIVGIFVVAEWLISLIFERSLGANYAEGLLPQALTLGTVLVLGFSARSIHRLVESRLGQVFFRKKLKGIADIQRVAREADASTDAGAMMDLACVTVSHGLESLGVACYVRNVDAYRLSASSGAVVSPAAYGFNDAVPLRLRRWQEPFEEDDDSQASHHMLFLPMSLRGELLGFLACGPKPDRTPYLRDEVDALSLLAHQIGIATAWLEPSAIGLHPAASPA
ncbi:MAG TPA: hypothetical protein VIN40_03175 [Candidatus Tyrphobacter sp.]